MKRRNFIASTMIGSLTANILLPDSFALSGNHKPKAITNKIKKTSLKPFYIKPDNHTQVITTKMRFDQTNNQFSSVELIIPPKTMGPAPHVHKDLDEVMRVITGTITILVGEEIFMVEEGGWHLRPHGIVHTFWNAADQPATFIDFYPNQNFEVFLEEMLKVFAQLEKEGIAQDSKEGRRRQDELHAEWGMVVYYDQRQPLMEKYGLK